MSARKSRAFWLLLALLAAPMVPAAWTPEDDEWASFRGDNEHAGARAGTSLFTDGEGGFHHLKWSKDIDFPVLYAPPVADLDEDGVREILVTSNDIKTQVGPPPDIQFSHRIQALEGDDGATEWTKNEANSFQLVAGANAVDVDGDNNAEVLYFAGNPLTGTSATNKAVALQHDGAEKWRWSSGDWGLIQHPVGILAGTQTASVATDANNEAVLGVVLADILIGTKQAGAGCPNPNAQKISIEASNIHYYIHALNGEGANPNVAWERHVDPGLMFSTPLITDLDGDGDLDVVWGSGTPEGVIIPSCSAEVSVDESAVDNRVIARSFDGGALWESSFEDPAGVARPIPATPVLAGTTAGGDPILVFLVPVSPNEPEANDPDRNILLALNGRTGETLWTLTIRPASIFPLATADLDDDGQAEIIVQVDNRLATFRNDGTDFWAQGAGDFRGKAYARDLTSTGPAVADLDADGTLEIATILDGGRGAADPKSQLLVVNGATGAVEWTADLVQDDAVAGPVLADVDGDDDLLEIIVGTGSFTLGDAADHAGKVFVFEPNAPDLLVTNLELVGNAVNRDPQTVRATVDNDGTRDLNGALFRLLADGVTVADKTVNLADGATATLDFDWTPASKGTHSLRVVADPADDVGELVETNNERALNVNIKARFDLSIVPADVTFDPANPAKDDVVTVKARVRNLGEVTSPANKVRFEEAGIPLDEERNLPSLAPNAFADVTITFTVTEERTHTFAATADPAAALDEEREDNNRATKDLAVRVIRPDFEILEADIVFDNDEPANGDTVTLTATIHNVGNKDAPASMARVLESGNPVGADVDVPAIAQGASAAITKSFTIAEEREHLFTVVADPADLVLESDEGNNEATKSLVVRVIRPDFEVTAADIAFDNANPEQGDLVTLTATLHNVGDQDAPATTARLFESGVLLEEFSVAALPIGDSTTIEHTFTVAEERDHVFKIVIDPLNLVLESRESNNEATKTLPVRITRPDLVAISLTAPVGIADPGDVVQLTATFSNEGDRELSDFLVHFLDQGGLVAVLDGVPLDEGETTSLTFDWTVTEPRDVHTLTVRGVAVGDEPNGDNNEASLEILVGRLAVAVAMAQPVFGPMDDVTGLVRTTFRGTNLPVPGIPVNVEVYYRITVGGAISDTLRARILGTTDADGLLPFTVPKTLLGDVTVCLNGECPLDDGNLLGLAPHPPGSYRALAHADRFGFDFHGEAFYAVAPPAP